MAHGGGRPGRHLGQALCAGVKRGLLGASELPCAAPPAPGRPTCLSFVCCSRPCPSTSAALFLGHSLQGGGEAGGTCLEPLCQPVPRPVASPPRIATLQAEGLSDRGLRGSASHSAFGAWRLWTQAPGSQAAGARRQPGAGGISQPFLCLVSGQFEELAPRAGWPGLGCLRLFGLPRLPVLTSLSAAIPTRLPVGLCLVQGSARPAVVPSSHHCRSPDVSGPFLPPAPSLWPRCLSSFQVVILGLFGDGCSMIQNCNVQNRRGSWGGRGSNVSSL